MAVSKSTSSAPSDSRHRRASPPGQGNQSSGAFISTHQVRLHLALLVMLVATACLIALVYCSAERYVYYWDYGGFWQVTAEQVSLLGDSPLQWLHALVDSMSQDYPRFYTVAPTPLLLVFGTSRIAYVLALTLVYQLPFALLMGAIAVEVVKRRSWAVFWIAAFSTLLIPTIWMVTLRGYPDVGGAVLLALATWIYLRDPRLGSWKAILVIGLCLAVTPIYRRHFAYSSILFFVAAGATSVLHAARQAQGAFPRGLKLALRDFTRLAAVGLVFTGLMITLGSRWLDHALALDRSNLYRSYETSVPDWLLWGVRSYGGLIWMMAVIGLALAITTGRCSRERVQFLVILSVLTMATWLTMIRQVGWHYQLHFAPFIIVGVTLLVWSGVEILSSLRARVLLLAPVAALLVLNFAMGLAGLQPVWLANARWVFAEPGGPLHRSDYHEVMRLVDFLRAHASENDPVSVIDSSSLLNDDLLRKAELAAYGADGRRLRVLVSPHVDSRDFLPLENILTSEFVVTSDPFRPEQGHLPVPQKVVAAGAKAVLGKWKTALDFERLPETFDLGPGTTFSVLRRVRHTPWKAALKTLIAMDSFVGDDPPETDWFLLQQPSPSSISRNEDGSSTCRTHLGFSNLALWAPVLAYLGPLEPSVRLEFTLRYTDQQNFSNAGPARVEIRSINRRREVSEIASASGHKGERIEAFDFPLTLPADTIGLILEVSAGGNKPSITNGTIELGNLRVRGTASTPG